MSAPICAMAAGMQIVTLPWFSLKEMLSNIEKYKVTDIFVFVLMF